MTNTEMYFNLFLSFIYYLFIYLFILTYILSILYAEIHSKLRLHVLHTCSTNLILHCEHYRLCELYEKIS